MNDKKDEYILITFGRYERDTTVIIKSAGFDYKKGIYTLGELMESTFKLPPKEQIVEKWKYVYNTSTKTNLYLKMEYRSLPDNKK
jgi:hypothetical protein